MTKKVDCGGVPIGGGAPVTVQSMTNAKDIDGIIAQIKRLEDAGCEIVRVSVPTEQAAKDIEKIKANATIPVVADIHFDYRLAISAIEYGADKIRINPGNIGEKDRLKQIVAAARKKNIPIRIGVNAGSMEKDILKEYGYNAEALAESALKNTRYLESFDFDDIVISMKSSNIRMTFEAHKILSPKTDHPIHIGITEAGIGEEGIIRSSIGIGSLLLNGIGDTIRVSLTGDPVREVEAGIEILTSLGLKKGGIEIISCPTCARCEVDLEDIVSKVKINTDNLKNDGEKITVAIMGCAVNGPGEASHADIGIACGKEEGLLFIAGKPVKKVKESDMITELISLIESKVESLDK